MSEGFELDPRLARETYAVADWALSSVRLMNEANFPWLILVPRRPDLSDVTDVDQADLPVLAAEVYRAAEAVKEIFKPDKLNVAALGNQVPQLHIHVIARFRNDAAWPRPVWGTIPPRHYSETMLNDRLKLLRRHFEDG